MEQSSKRKLTLATSDNESSDSRTSFIRRQSPRLTPDSRAYKRQKLDTSGSKSSLSPNRGRVDTYSTTRSCNFSSTSSCSSLNTVKDPTQASSISSVEEEKGEKNSGDTSSTISTTTASSSAESLIRRHVDLSAKRDISAGEGCSTWTNNSSRPTCRTRLRNRVHICRYPSNTSSDSETAVSGGNNASSSCSDTSTLVSSDITSTSCSSSSTSTSSGNRPTTKRWSSVKKRELKNLKDAWSTEVSPFKTRSGSEDKVKIKRRTPRKKIHFVHEDSTSSCYPSSSHSSARSASSELLSSEGESTSQLCHVDSIDEAKRETVGQSSSPTKQVSSSLTDDLLVSSDTLMSESPETTLHSKQDDLNKSSSSNKLNFDDSDFSSISSLELPSISCKDECPKRVSRSLSSERSKNPTRKSTHQTPSPIKRNLRSRHVSDKNIASTSTAASNDCYNTLPTSETKLCGGNNVVGTNTSESNEIVTPIKKITRGKTKSGNTSVKTIHVTKKDSVDERPTLMSILTAEHDYFKKDTDYFKKDTGNEVKTDISIGPCHHSGEPNINTNRTFTIDSTTDSHSDFGFYVVESSSADDKLSMARSDNALSGMPSDGENLVRMNSTCISANIINQALPDAARPLCIDSGSAISLNDEGKNLGFDLNDFVIRRRRLRSESTQDELWEGLPAVVPFRKQSKERRADSAASESCDEEDLEQEIGTGEQIQAISLKKTCSSTTDIISEIESILSDTTSSSCQQFPCDEVTQFKEEDEFEGYPMLNSPRFTSSSVQKYVNEDLNSATRDCFDESSVAKFSSNSETLNSSYPPSSNEDGMGKGDVLEDRRLGFSGYFSETPSETSRTPIASRPESVWFSEKSEDWASPTGSPLGINHDPSKGTLEKKQNYLKAISEKSLRSSINNFESENQSLCGSESSDTDFYPDKFKVTETNEDHQSGEENDSVVASSSDTSSSTEFLLWNKKKDKRRQLSFPKIVLRKCKETTKASSTKYSSGPKIKGNSSLRRNTEAKKNESERSQSGRKKRDSVGSSDDSSTPKRSVRLRKNSSSSHSTDFVYTPLKRDDVKTKLPTHDTGSSPSSKESSSQPEKKRRKISREITPEPMQTDRPGSSKDPSVGIMKDEEKEARQKNRTKKKRDRPSDERSFLDLYDSPVISTRRRKGPLLDEELLANPVIDKHACVLWSSEHRRHFQMKHPEAKQSELDELLREQWTSQLTAQEKMRYFIRARDAVRDEDKHAPRSSRDKRRGGRKTKEDKEDEITSLEMFTKLKIKRQKDLLTKWLHFFQKVLSRKEYADFIEEVKEGILEAEARDKPNKSRGLTSKIFSHKRLLFQKMFKLKDHVMKQYFYRVQKQKQLQGMAFQILIKRLIEGKPCAFIKGCRSRLLTTILQDLKELEYGDSVAVLGYPIATSSFTSLYKEIVETVDSCMFNDVTEAEPVIDEVKKSEIPHDAPVDDAVSSTPTIDRSKPDTSSEDEQSSKTSKGGNDTINESSNSVDTSESHVWFEDEQINCDLANALLNDLTKQPSLPVLDTSALDAVFLPPPAWVPASSCQLPIRPISLTSRAASMRPSGSFPPMYNFSPMGSRSGQMFQRMAGIRYMMPNAQRIPNFRRAADMNQQSTQSVLNRNQFHMNLPHSSQPMRMPRFPPPPVRDVMYTEAREAFRRTYTSTSNSCCEMDSPSCVLSTWVAADQSKSN